jgi:spoIIIJ-associated protein
MKKVEAKTLEEAYRIACDELGCSMTELRYEIIQYPSKGLFGLFAKPAVIVAMREARAAEAAAPEARAPRRPEREAAPGKSTRGKERAPRHKEPVAAESDTPSAEASRGESEGSHEAIIDSFFEENGDAGTPEQGEGAESELRLQEEIEAQLKALIARSCFDIDVVEVDVIDDTAYIFLDGEDAALIIGKEGYRYNALSYLLFNWIHGRYKLFIKLEIAQFLSSQEEMIRHTIQPVIEHVKREGWGRTRPLDGILVQIALEQLRETFPDKYVAIKRQRDGGRYVLINEFNSRRR